MSDAVRLGAVVNDLYEQCRHERTEVRYKMFSNGTKHLCSQCMICYQRPSGSGWLPQDGVDMDAVLPFDEARAEEHRASQVSEHPFAVGDTVELRWKHDGKRAAVGVIGGIGPDKSLYLEGDARYWDFVNQVEVVKLVPEVQP